MSQGCASCGAPAQPGVITCPFCGQIVAPEAAANAVHCPKCETLNAREAKLCSHCRSSLIVQCVFCQHVSPCDLEACASCGEVFAGSVERKAARDAEQQRAQTWNTVGQVAGVAGSLLGALAGVSLGGGDEPAPRHHQAQQQSGGLFDGIGGAIAEITGEASPRRDDDDKG
jgi:phage FluMu protein Com